MPGETGYIPGVQWGSDNELGFPISTANNIRDPWGGMTNPFSSGNNPWNSTQSAYGNLSNPFSAGANPWLNTSRPRGADEAWTNWNELNTQAHEPLADTMAPFLSQARTQSDARAEQATQALASQFGGDTSNPAFAAMATMGRAGAAAGLGGQTATLKYQAAQDRLKQLTDLMTSASGMANQEAGWENARRTGLTNWNQAAGEWDLARSQGQDSFENARRTGLTNWNQASGEWDLARSQGMSNRDMGIADQLLGANANLNDYKAKIYAAQMDMYGRAFYWVPDGAGGWTAKFPTIPPAPTYNY